MFIGFEISAIREIRGKVAHSSPELQNYSKNGNSFFSSSRFG